MLVRQGRWRSEFYFGSSLFWRLLNLCRRGTRVVIWGGFLMNLGAGWFVENQGLAETVTAAAEQLETAQWGVDAP